MIGDCRTIRPPDPPPVPAVSLHCGSPAFCALPPPPPPPPTLIAPAIEILIAELSWTAPPPAPAAVTPQPVDRFGTFPPPDPPSMTATDESIVTTPPAVALSVGEQPPTAPPVPPVLANSPPPPPESLNVPACDPATPAPAPAPAAAPAGPATSRRAPASIPPAIEISPSATITNARLPVTRMVVPGGTARLPTWSTASSGPFACGDVRASASNSVSNDRI